VIQVVSYGAGTNSTAMLVEMVRLGEPIHAVTFADTGGERPETYATVLEMSEWLVARGYPAIVTVQSQDRDGNAYTLEQRCLEQKMLPSIAYGFKACSEKHKIRPQNRWMNNWQPAIDCWAAGDKVVKCIGYDADEERRAHIMGDEKYAYRYPLIEWGWGRDECVAAIAAAGLRQPGKSACFFCPSSRPAEIMDLRQQHPILFQRALALEANAELHTIKGLGRQFAWRDLVAWREAQMDMFTVEQPCGCYDG
jgi:hypothetical protein